MSVKSINAVCDILYGLFNAMALQLEGKKNPLIQPNEFEIEDGERAFGLVSLSVEHINELVNAVKGIEGQCEAVLESVQEHLESRGLRLLTRPVERHGTDFDVRIVREQRLWIEGHDAPRVEDPPPRQPPEWVLEMMLSMMSRK